MKKFFSLLLVITMLFSVAACGGGTASAPAPDSASTDAAAPDKTATDVKIGILIPGSPTDGGFSQAAAEAGKKIESTYGYKVSVVEAGDADTIKSESETMAAEGYAIVFGHGGQCASPMAEISGDYPDTWFVTFGGTNVTENQFPVIMNAEEGFYASGVIAGLMTKTNKIAWTVGGDYPAYIKSVNGWELGAKAANPDVEVMSAVLSATDATEAYETVMNQIKSGADMILSNTNEGQVGAIKAVSESDGVFAFGAIGNFNDADPTRVISSTVCDYSVGYMSVTKSIMDGSAKSEITYLTVANGSVQFVWNDALKATLPADVVAAAEKAIEDVKSGAIKVPNEFELDK